MKTKKIALIIAVIIIIFFIIYNAFLKEKKADFALFEAVMGNVIEEVSETGQVKMGKTINLGFQNSGTLSNIFVRVGSEVSAGASLAKLNTNELTIQLQKAQANLEINQAKLNQILAGSTPEEIQITETALKNARQTLQDTLDGSYEKANSALTTVNSIQKTYFNGSDQESITVKDKQDRIKNVLTEAKQYLDLTKSNPTNENINSAFLKLKSALEDVYAGLTVIRSITENSSYKNTVTLADKTSLDTAKTNVNTGLTNINTAQGDVNEAEDDLALKKAGPRQADVDLYQAQVKQAQAEVDLLKNQIWEATLRSPVRGKVTAINKEVGEIVQPSLSESVIALLPTDPYEIEADIYEEDVVKITLNDTVTIKLPAFPEQTFSGKVISIDPAEKLIEGIVYYTVAVSFENPPEGTKPGMSADIAVKTDEKNDVLTVPGAAIEKKNGKALVKIPEGEKLVEKEIQIGLSGTNDLVEVISGLTAGEKIAIPK